MSNSKKINSELSLISRYIGLKYSKYILFTLLIIVCYPMPITPLYILLVSFFMHIVLGLTDGTHKAAKDATKDFILMYTAQKYKFTVQKYRNEQYGCIVTLFLLFIWQVIINIKGIYEMPLRAIPASLITIYVFTRIITGMVAKYKIRHNFMNLNI